MHKIAVWSAAAGLTSEQEKRLQLVVEELFVNTVTHGHGGDCNASIVLNLTCAPGGVHLSYRDHAPPFNTGQRGSGKEGEPAVGGLGMALIAGLSQSLHYRRSGHCNLTELLL